MVVTENARLLGCLRQPSVGTSSLMLPLPEMVCFFSKLITPGPCSLTLSESSGRARESNTGFASHRASAHSSRSFSIPCLKQRLFSNCLSSVQAFLLLLSHSIRLCRPHGATRLIHSYTLVSRQDLCKYHEFLHEFIFHCTLYHSSVFNIV